MNDSEEDVRNYADRRRLKSAFLVIVTDIEPRGVYLHFIVHFIIYLFIYLFIHLLDWDGGTNPQEQISHFVESQV